MKLTYRYIARIVLEAETGLFVGSGEASLLKDALVQKDHHGLPMIQGASLSGVLRHAIEDANSDTNAWEELFGFQKKDTGVGSRLRVSSAYMMVNESSVAEGLNFSIDDKVNNVKTNYENLPSRQHVRISEKGVAQKNGLFDNEVVYKGTRFLFELELKGTEEDTARWNKLLKTLYSPLFRIGQGTRNGYGKLKVLSLKSKVFNLNDEKDFDTYLHFDPSFNAPNSCLAEVKLEVSGLGIDMESYTLQLKPDNFFIFGAGAGDDEVDNKPVEEEVAKYRNDTIEFEKQTLIPASSIKGALAHRTAFHYNKLTGKFADNNEGDTGKENPAVNELFGVEAKGKTGQRGRVILDDAYYSKSKVEDKIFNHVAIDRFTGGAMDGALFSEKVSVLKAETSFDLSIHVEKAKGSKGHKGNEGDEEEVLLALEEAMKDICKGLLPLGGMTTKGHGIFTGELLKNDKPLFNYE
jgi:CRISPR/Cas system CSM-associated protein Csm3 (group 7 of RAMP superfamily)